VVRQAEVVATLADLAGALSLESYNGNPSPWRDAAVRAKPFAGQAAAGESMRAILAGSYLLDPANVISVQDPLSFRVMPQVHGALRDQVAFARHAVEVELNSIGDNPMVCVESAELISTGNFQPMTLALGFDALRVGVGHVGLLSERRMQKGLATWFAAGNASADAVTDGEPASPEHGTAEPEEDGTAGRRSRVSPLAAYSAAADVAELRHLATPVTLNSPPLDLDIEDHATLAPTAVFLTRRSLALLEEILAIEIMMAAAIIEFRGVARHGAGTASLLAAVEGALDALDPDASTASAVEAVRAVAVSEATRATVARTPAPTPA